ncbi:MAG: polysaccharide deacetylase family protein [Candidatus Firestonebacteria bacterium]
MLKSIIILLIGFLLFSVCYSYGDDFWVTILCYHKIIPQNNITNKLDNNDESEYSKKTDLIVSAENFERQMKFIKESYSVISLKDFIEHMDLKKTLDSNSVVITFDDGDKSIYTYAYPILKKYNIPTTVFIYTNVAKEKRGLNWDEIKEMSNNGIDFGSHTISHCNLVKKLNNETHNEYEERIKKELVDSKKIIEEKTGKEIEYLAYPYGEYDEFVKDEAIKLGYKATLIVKWGKNYVSRSKYDLKRRIVCGKYTMKEFIDIFRTNTKNE